MTEHAIDPVDEARHLPDGERFWNESYYFDFHADDGSLGGYVRLGLYPNLGVTWYWACLVGAGRRLITLIEPAAPVPDAPSLELRHGGLRAQHVCETPTRRFRLDFEGPAVVLEDPVQAYGAMRGERKPLGFDLEWETDGPGGYRFRDLTRYEVPCRVRGRIQACDEEWRFRGHGQRDHSWGVRDWWASAWCWNAGRLDDGTRFHSVAPRTLEGADVPWAAGYVQAPGEAPKPIHRSLAREEVDADGLPVRGRIEVGELCLEVMPLYFAPVQLTDPDGRVSRFPRCLAQYTADDGRRGYGWIEWNQPQPR